MSKNLKACVMVVAGVLIAGAAGAATRTWNGGDGKWNTPGNWSGSAVPVAGDDVVFDNTSVVNCLADAVNDNLASITVASTYSGIVTFQTNCVAGTSTLNLAGDLTVNGGKIVFQRTRSREWQARSTSSSARRRAPWCYSGRSGGTRQPMCPRVVSPPAHHNHGEATT